jgi:sugar lactone lactonase YvrE
MKPWIKTLLRPSRAILLALPALFATGAPAQAQVNVITEDLMDNAFRTNTYGGLLLIDQIVRILRNIVISLLFLFACGASAQQTGNISTYAGGGPNNLPALSASIGIPEGLAFDDSGNLHIADPDNDFVFKVDGEEQLTAVAGNGTFFGSLFRQFLDGGPATSATLFGPRSVAFDTAGNMFVADGNSNRIRRVDHVTGVITTVAGKGSPLQTGFAGDGGRATDALLWGARALAFDAGGSLYISDPGNSRVRKVVPGADGLITGEPGEIITTIAGNGIRPLSIDGVGGDPADDANDGDLATNSSLLPQELTFDADGNLFVGDVGHKRIRRIDSMGVITTVAGDGTGAYSGDGGPATSAGLSYPQSITIDGFGNLFLGDSGRVRKVDAGPDGKITGSLDEIITTVAGTGAGGFSGDGGPAALATFRANVFVSFDSSGDLYIGDYTRVRRVAPGSDGEVTGAEDEIINTVAGNGLESFSGDGFPATSAMLASPSGIAFDASGNLFIADSNNYRVRRVDAETGHISTVAGDGNRTFSGDGEPASSASIASPWRIAVDASNNIFIASYNRIRRVDALTGIITTVAGDGTEGFTGDGGLATYAQIGRHLGISVSHTGNLFIADANNNRVRRVDAESGIITTVAGSGPIGRPAGNYGGDLGCATDALLGYPLGVTVEEDGDLLIADTDNARIRHVEAGPDGEVTGACDEIDEEEIITTVAGGGTGGFGVPATDANLREASDVVVDSAGNIFISSKLDERVKRVDAGADGEVTGAGDEIITLIAGGCCFNGDGIPATDAYLFSPRQLAVTASGVLYIADSGNNRVRRVPLQTIAQIDIKPGSDPNCFNINGHGVIPVAILGDEHFDVDQIDLTSLSFAGLAVRVRGQKGPLCAIEHSNNDPYPDLVCHFEDDPANWAPGDSEATLTGMLLDGTPFEGTDSICIVP